MASAGGGGSLPYDLQVAYDETFKGTTPGSRPMYTICVYDICDISQTSVFDEDFLTQALKMASTLWGKLINQPGLQTKDGSNTHDHARLIVSRFPHIPFNGPFDFLKGDTDWPYLRIVLTNTLPFPRYDLIWRGQRQSGATTAAERLFHETFVDDKKRFMFEKFIAVRKLSALHYHILGQLMPAGSSPSGNRLKKDVRTCAHKVGINPIEFINIQGSEWGAQMAGITVAEYNRIVSDGADAPAVVDDTIIGPQGGAATGRA